MKRKQEFEKFFSQKRLKKATSNDNISLQKHWKRGLIQLLSTLISADEAAALVNAAQLKDCHYPILYEWFSLHENLSPCLTHPWQLELLTGEACYLMAHLLKIDTDNNTAAHYAVMAGAGSEILKQIREKAPSLFFAEKGWNETLLFSAYCYKNKLAFEWLIKKMPENEVFGSQELWSLVKTKAWPEGLELMVECSPNFRLPIILTTEQPDNFPALFKKLKETGQFPFRKLDPLNDFVAVMKMLQGQLKPSVSQIEWYKANIPDFTDFLKNIRDPLSGNTLLHHILYCDDFDSNLFTSIVREAPELLAIKNDEGTSVTWGVFCHEPDFFKSVFSFNNDCTTLDGIFIEDEGSGGLYVPPEDYVEGGFDRLNELLFDNYTIQRLDFTPSTKGLLKDYFNTYEKVPTYISYLKRNNLLFLLFLAMNDEGSLFTSNLSWNLMACIINKLIELSPSPSKFFLRSPNPPVIKFFKEQVAQITDFQDADSDSAYSHRRICKSTTNF